jgi:uncharacterized repeat protein (TIGR04138 family)
MSEKLERSIEDLARADHRYPPAAYLLVFEGLEVALSRLAHRRHVAPRELLEGIRDAALDQWGFLARGVLESWNVRTTQDLGDLVFNLIARGLLVAGDEDHRAQFDEVFDFREGFDEAFEDRLAQQPPRVTADRG